MASSGRKLLGGLFGNDPSRLRECRISEKRADRYSLGRCGSLDELVLLFSQVGRKVDLLQVQSFWPAAGWSALPLSLCCHLAQAYHTKSATDTFCDSCRLWNPSSKARRYPEEGLAGSTRLESNHAWRSRIRYRIRRPSRTNGGALARRLQRPTTIACLVVLSTWAASAVVSSRSSPLTATRSRLSSDRIAGARLFVCESLLASRLTIRLRG